MKKKTIEVMKDSWNHRVLAIEYEGKIYFEVHEVYYKNGIPISCTKKPVSVEGESTDSIEWELKMIKKCLKKPILWGNDKFPEEFKSLC